MKRGQRKPERVNSKYEFSQQGTDVKIPFEDSLKKEKRKKKRRVKWMEISRQFVKEKYAIDKYIKKTPISQLTKELNIKTLFLSF